MGRLLDRLREPSPIYEVKPDADGFVLIGRPGHGEAFNTLVREAAASAGEDFLVFTTTDGQQGYSRMFVMPFEAERS